jgi:hypothetical protein
MEPVVDAQKSNPKEEENSSFMPFKTLGRDAANTVMSARFPDHSSLGQSRVSMALDRLSPDGFFA